MFRYDINIEGTNYVAILNDTGAKVVWERVSQGSGDAAIFRKRLDGSFTMNRSGNEPLYDRIMVLTYCEFGTLLVSDKVGEIISGTFRKKDLGINEDKCIIKINFQREDEYTCLDGLAEKDFNILGNYPNRPMPKFTTKYYYGRKYEYAYGYGDATIPGAFRDGYLEIDTTYGLPGTQLYPYPSGGYTFEPTGRSEGDTWSLITNEYLLNGDYDNGAGGTPGPPVNVFHIKSTWVHEVKIIMREGTDVSPTPTNTGEACDDTEWIYAETYSVPRGPGGIIYDKFVRGVNMGDFERENSKPADTVWSTFSQNRLLPQCGERNLDRCRKLNDVIAALIQPCFPNGFESIFFKSEINPMSGADLSNILIAQKSDAISPDSSDPATRGILNFKKLMGWLQAMFNVYYGVTADGVFRIEHKKYWDNNGSYTVPNTVDIDLTVDYPMSLFGTNEYEYEGDLPLRETFKFMEAWNIDFVGTDISYENCLVTGSNMDHSADQITTDIDPEFLDSQAAKEGFVLLHCDSVGSVPKLVPGGDPNPSADYPVIPEIGELTGTLIPNAHLSWANLHKNYWKYDRYLPQGLMNNRITYFEVRPLKYQSPITFPWCFQYFNPLYLLRTRLGDGIVKSAEWSFKAAWIKVNLMYKEDE